MIDYMVQYINWATLGDTGRLRRFKSLFRYIGTNKSTVQRTTAKNQTALVKKVHTLDGSIDTYQPQINVQNRN